MIKVRLISLFSCLLLICIFFIFACKSDESETEPKNDNPADTISVADLDTFSDHLRFLGATKKPGKSPVYSGSSSLKISLKDTLYLMDEIKGPIKFLHEDTTKNVAGVYIQVHSMVGGGSLATYFYDVPEIPEMADDDSVSVVLVGVDHDGLEDIFGVPPAGAPFIFDVTIIPYGENGQTLGQTTRPVKIKDQMYKSQ
ncbi:hypothetical protein GXP67_20190 [Rhodocytophaga rosea]|uniref:Uncharacterized protein n=1 Tax=Rhodocytophaga rosea TaxID=2704465 RepID=A0A6C0GLW8_9BACT|nr:hypothetical protein [Rhodocytophaga rosea]QHT68804.1 hypothetical protein GXP67_20190 [Rhodocytophaga rosea]